MSNNKIADSKILSNEQILSRAKKSLEEGICYISGRKLESVGIEGNHEGVKKTINTSKTHGIHVFVHPRFA